MYTNLFKRIIDFLAALAGLIILSPVLLIVLIILAFSNQGTPFFFQQRPGRNNRLFKLVKLKTMNDKRNRDGNLLPDRQRLTRVGRFVRAASLDELPQLINVIKGDMSLVGPRPLLIKYLPLYTKEQARRHEVRPGITGWAQVNGRNAIEWDEKFKLDVWYVDHLSFGLDCKIIWMTLCKVLKREAINQQGQATMEAFVGNIRERG